MIELDLLETLTKCESVDSLYTSTSKIINQMGYEHFIYGVRVKNASARVNQFVLCGYPDEWWERYLTCGYLGIDPLIPHCLKSVTPVIWDDRLFKTQRSTQLMNEAREFGLVSGVTLPIRSPGEAALLSLATSVKPDKAKKDIMATLGDARLLTGYLHEAVQRIALKTRI